MKHSTHKSNTQKKSIAINKRRRWISNPSRCCGKRRSGTSFQFFPGRGNFDRLPRGGDKIWKKQNFVGKNTKKSLFVKIRGGHLPPPDDVPGGGRCNWSIRDPLFQWHKLSHLCSIMNKTVILYPIQRFGGECGKGWGHRGREPLWEGWLGLQPQWLVN